MAVTYTRTYDRAHVARSHDGLTDVVLSVYCSLSAAADDGLTALAGETISLDPPDPSQFVPFDQITQELIDSWVVTREQYIKLEQKLASMIEAQRDPPVIVVPLPFNAAEPIVDPVITDSTGN